jgi:hypothetical protein|eukprot:COSAG02_NODE_4910_length_4843_cov_369.569562_3_plen_84_part_00
MLWIPAVEASTRSLIRHVTLDSKIVKCRSPVWIPDDLISGGHFDELSGKCCFLSTGDNLFGGTPYLFRRALVANVLVRMVLQR